MMLFYSTKNPDHKVSFETALLTGMAEDGGLYMPEKIPKLTAQALRSLRGASLAEVAFLVARKFIGEAIPEEVLQEICETSYNFPVPIFQLEEGSLVLELFHGPTGAFKDFAARFMARCTSYFLTKSKAKRNILVATSGDTGGAIGSSFFGLEGVNVFTLYPKGGVSLLQEKQLTTMGGNVKAIEIDGTFDDCQRLSKAAFADRAFNDKFQLMSANSINIGRIIPQSFYHIWSSIQIAQNEGRNKLLYAVPSGNFGNLFGGILAKQMGAPIYRLIAANNANHPFIDYLKTGNFQPQESINTLSNAMDIGHPNNYYRIDHLFNHKVSRVREMIDGAYFTDKQTAEAIINVYHDYGYILCPHTAVAYLGEAKFRKEGMTTVTVATADPAKFRESIEPILESKVPMPENLEKVLTKKKQAVSLPPTLEALETYLAKVIS